MRKTFSIGVAAFLACTGMAMGQTSSKMVTPTDTKGKTQSNTTTMKPTSTATTPTKTTNKTTNKTATKTTGTNTGKTVATTNVGDPFPAYTTANRPTKQHFELTSTYMGEWATTTTSWTGENTAPQTTTGTARFFPAMNGRFICGDIEGTLFGKPFKGMGFWGYNTNQNQYENTWVDTENTGISTFVGTKTDSNTFTWNGTVTNPLTGKPTPTKCITTVSGKDSFTYTMYSTNTNGGEYKVFETTYNRVSQGGPFAIRPVESRLSRTNGKQPATRTTSVTDQQTQTEK